MRSTRPISNRAGLPFTAVVLTLCAANAESAPLSGCYIRHYDAAHLAAHPTQQVREVALSLAPMSGDHGQWAASGTLRISVKGHKGYRSVSGDCTQKAGTLTCDGDCDTGEYRVMFSGQASVLMTITDRLLLQRDGCDDEDYFELKPDKENTQFLLHSAPASSCK